MLLTGNFVRAVDEKLRVAIPKQLRDAMNCLPGAGVFVAPGNDKSLAIYTEDAFQRLADRLATAPPTQHDVRAYTRLFYGLTQRVELDGQGRIRIPAELAQLAELDKEAILLGVRDHLELWSKAAWEHYLAERQSRFDEIAEAAFREPSASEWSR
ncbi:MAG: division/cell wall cluster transcriptional repressor MraZ [Thermoguttaceae bacterium]|nr:division/cell wall cluster transcriptional repressor MraZ [Thermoguttaceae bacterium]